MINVNLIRTGGFTNVMLKSYKDYPEIRGELKERVLLNAARLCSPIYRASAIYTQDKNGWPGDWEGRTLLALVSHMKCTGIEPPYLSSVLESIPDHLNSRGYLGGISEEGLFDEQQLSGHNWLIRGLMEYYLLTGDKEISNLVNKIVENLYIPLKGYYLDYPIDPEVRKEQGSFSGTLSGKSGHFILSTDIGCAFMCLDGLSQYYDIFRNPDVYELLDEMVSVFEKIDFVGSHMQTHATLSAVRGIIRLYKATFDDRFLKMAVSVFDLYIKNGMTENYANFNWFGRFDTWTEPCAITDSLMVSTELYKITEDKYYLNLSTRIYLNAFCYAQRCNGGFGTDTAVGPAEKYLKPKGAGISEAFWCCTMRGAEGLSYMCENMILCDGNSDLYIPFGGSFKFSNSDYTLNFDSLIPYEGSCKVSVEAKRDISFNVFVFDGASYEKISVRLKSGEFKTFSMAFEIKKHEEAAFTTEGTKYFYGNLLLGTGNPKVRPLADISLAGDDLQPLTNMKDVSPEDAVFECRQILF